MGSGRIIRFAVRVIAVVVSWAVLMFCWNVTIPDLFKGPYITYFQMAALSTLVYGMLYGVVNIKKGERNERPEDRTP